MPGNSYFSPARAKPDFPSTFVVSFRLMPAQLTAERIIELLGLKPHPTCGFVTETYRAQQRFPHTPYPVRSSVPLLYR